MSRDVQRPAVWPVSAAGAVLIGLVAYVPAALPSYQIDRLYATAYLFTGCWVLGSAQVLWLRPADPTGPRRAVWAALTMWAGLDLLIWHVFVAYQRLGSHADVVEHTRRTAGVGWGVYVNYLFAAVWLADTVWLTAATRSYARRPRWVGRMVHGFLAFVVFNATVVYGELPTRLAGGVWFAILGISWWRRARFTVPSVHAAR